MNRNGWNPWDDDDMRSHRYDRRREATPVEQVIGGAIGTVAGIIITIGMSGIFSRNSSYARIDSYGFRHPILNDGQWMMIAFGCLFILSALGILIAGIVKLKKEKEAEQREAAEMAAKAAREQARALETRIPEKKTILYCPYCGAAQDEDYKVCGSCGAGRNGKK